MTLPMRSKSKVVIISNGITPYGVHFFTRVAEELTEYRIKTLYSYQFCMGHWDIALPPVINAEILGKGEEVTGRSSVKGWLQGWKRGRQLIGELVRTRPLAVMIQGYGYLAHLMVILWCYRHRLPCMMWADSNIKGENVHGMKANVKRYFLTRVIARCRAILVCGTLGARYYENYGAGSGKIFFVPNEPDYALIEGAQEKTAEEIEQDYALAPHRRRFFYSGRLVKAKRVDLLLDAFLALADRRPEWDLVIAGDGPLRYELREKIPYRLQGRVVWIGFISTPEKMAALYHVVDVLVLPSDYEPWALVVNEAACAGLALICSDVVGAAEELLRDGKNGRLFQAGNVSSLIEAMIDVSQENNLSAYRQTSRCILREWRDRADPVCGLKNALEYCVDHDRQTATHGVHAGA